ncbi:MAG: family 10 glycosylhydrolase [Bacteroidales bacterium]|nr:family 10 glycosylhydrolase [Bacteroidales bacterium]
MKKIFIILFTALIVNLHFNSASSQVYDGKHEWRAVWIATVNNIDWPSRPGLSSQEQQKELIEYLDLFKKMNFNAVVFQVRPTADAFFFSKYEPWSIYLTGDQKVAPSPAYDPLEFAIKECHKRGMELHAWLNPYRVSQDTVNLKEMSPNHIYRERPELFVRHGKKLYFDPAFPETREFLVKVIKDLVIRYDLDGIHFDDYFYPNNDFEDAKSFASHSRGFKPEDKMAWRRENVDLVIKMLRDTIKSVKPYVKFGISPYAVWRNKKEDPRGSETKSYSYTNYDHLHADILLWMERGWLDYILPQLYFNIGYEAADFKVLAKWWEDYNAGTPVYGGLGTYRLAGDAKIPEWRSANEIKMQADMLRTMPSYQGVCYFNAKNFKDNRLGINSVMEELYPYPALVPALKGIPLKAPAAPKNPKLTQTGDAIKITWDSGKQDKSDVHAAKYHLIYRFEKGEKPDFTKGSAIVALTGEDSYYIKESNGKDYQYYLSALDRLFCESKPAKVTGR